MGDRPQPIRDPHAALVGARELIADPERWTRSAPARRWKAPQMHEPAAWVPTHATDPYASRWCAAGALCAVSQMRSSPSGIEFLEAASRQLFGVGIGRANDDTPSTHTAMLRCYALAITLAETATAGMRASAP